ncbi:peptide/nickel transport system permease protein/oligopeptide transport system permease protein [Herbinix hemicellulosilytica]|uniref:Putative secreted protein n=1 Tax=Herbinix hemicellulosilytica TaxID=1564487 RepID=A0A0H5SUN2_HERHM|nr:ABC transporter permease [Herbinix hemicellulosilytica]RBP58971.1 peptide/nickel transport system permease protein/oligopeptide transport system permease protein [Herbinix hemicellulosilytica]CRZ34003.1 putative secreted protein [Herbinix hemicellulosilytica]
MKYTLKKLATLIVSLLITSVLTFTAFQIIPGDSALNALGMDATKEQLERYREEMGLNKSLPVRYINWLKGALKGDFGYSTQYQMQMKVSTLIKNRLTVTFWLAVMSFLLIVVISIPLGIFAAGKKNGIPDSFITLITQIFMSVPPFFLGMLITLIFGIILKWFTPGSYINPGENFGQFLRFMIFPAIAVAVPKIAMTVKFLRSSLLREMELDYVRTAKSKGMTKARILIRHILKNALIPVITFLAMMLADILAGAILVEQVFNLPGLGRLLVSSISNRDYAVVQAIILYIVSVVIIINFIVDLIYQWIDPRVKRD